MATKKTEKNIGMKVEVATDDYPQIRTYEFPEFNERDILTIKHFLYVIDYIGAKNIRVVEET